MRSETRSGRRPSAVAGACLVGLVLVVALVVALTVPRHGAAPDPAPAGGTTAFTVRGEAFTEADLDERLDVLEIVYGVDVPREAGSRFRAEAARSFAATLLISEDARARGLSASPAEITDTLDRYVQSRFPADGRAGFDRALQAAGLEEAAVVEEIRLQLAGQALFDLVTRDVSVTPLAVRRAYRSNPRAWGLPERRRLRALAVQDEATARQALRAIRSGVPFRSVVRRVSLDDVTRRSGGDLGVLARTDLDPAFAQEAFSAERGTLFGPVPTGRGWYVGRVEDVVPAEYRFDVVKTRIEESLLAQRSLARWNVYVATLLEDADVTYADGYRPGPGAPVVPGSRP